MTHTYSTNSRERREIPFFLATAGVAASFGLSVVFEHYHFVPPWWLSLPIDTMALYGFFYVLFDRILWKLQLTHLLHVTRVPNLSGEWRGHIRPMPGNGAAASVGVDTVIALTIKQTWTEMLITVQAPHSRSHSLSASVIVDEPCGISYEYRNEPAASALQTMHAHRGTAWLAYDGKHERLTGEYYSGRDRQNIGTIAVSRIRTR